MAMFIGAQPTGGSFGSAKIASAYVGNACVYSAKPKVPVTLFENGVYYWPDYTVSGMTITTSANDGTRLTGRKLNYVQFNNVNYNGKTGLYIYGSKTATSGIEYQAFLITIYDATTNATLLNKYYGDMWNSYTFPTQDVNIRIKFNSSDSSYIQNIYKVKVGEM